MRNGKSLHFPHQDKQAFVFPPLVIFSTLVVQAKPSHAKPVAVVLPEEVQLVLAEHPSLSCLLHWLSVCACLLSGSPVSKRNTRHRVWDSPASCCRWTMFCMPLKHPASTAASAMKNAAKSILAALLLVAIIPIPPRLWLFPPNPHSSLSFRFGIGWCLSFLNWNYHSFEPSW